MNINVNNVYLKQDQALCLCDDVINNLSKKLDMIKFIKQKITQDNAEMVMFSDEMYSIIKNLQKE
jgi:hypothetical protein